MDYIAKGADMHIDLSGRLDRRACPPLLSTSRD
jgi:hypothetical protein